MKEVPLVPHIVNGMVVESPPSFFAVSIHTSGVGGKT